MSVSRVAAAAAALVVMVLLAAPLTSGALWSQSSLIGAGTVTSGTLTLVNGTTAGDSVKAYTFTGLNASNLGPGGSVQAPLRINSTGDIDYAVRLSGASQSSTDLAGSMRVRAVPVSSAAACPATGDPAGTAVYDGTFAGITTGTSVYGSTVSAGSPTFWCLRVSLDQAATNTQMTKNGTVVLTFTAKQARNG